MNTITDDRIIKITEELGIGVIGKSNLLRIARAILAEAADMPSASMPVDSQIDFTAEIARLVKLSDALRANERRLIDDLESALASAAPKQSVPDGLSECRHCGFMVKLNEPPIGSSDMNVEANVALLRDRAAVGFKKYGVTTERTDLSQADWIQHTIEELLDAANYLQAMRNNPAKGK